MNNTNKTQTPRYYKKSDAANAISTILDTQNPRYFKNSNAVLTELDTHKEEEEVYSLVSAHTIISIVMILTLDVIFISIFYFLFVLKKEKELITHDLNGLVDSICGDLTILPDEQKKSILQSVNSMNSDTSNDQGVIDSNSIVYNKALKVLLIFFVISFIFILVVAIKYKINILPILLTNIILLFVIFCTELLYIYQINLNYIGLDSNLIKEYIITQLQQNN
jgi:hypothetical protein